MRRRNPRGMHRPLTWLIAGGLLGLTVAAGVDALHGRSSISEPVLVVTTTTVSVQAAPRTDRLPTCTAPQLQIVIEVPGGSAAVALRHVTGSPCHLGRLPVKLTVRDRHGNLVPLVGGEGLGVSVFRGDFSPGFEQLRNVTFLPACTPETIPHASYVLSARAGPYRARKRLSGVEIGCFGGG
jgi:hypothetical protein